MPILDTALLGGPVKGFASPDSIAHYAPDLELEPQHINIAVELDIPNRTAHLVVTQRVIARRPGARSLKLDGIDFANVHVVDATGNELTWSYDGAHIRVAWAAGVALGETREVVVSYTVNNPVSGLYFSQPDDAYPSVGYWAATDHETERARHWLACVDHPNVRTTLRFEITAEDDLTVLANGRFVEADAEAEHTTTIWELVDSVCPSYLICMAVGRFSTFDDGEFQGRPLQYFGADYVDPADLKRSFGRTGEMMAWMTKRLGVDFPFSKYFQFALPDVGGAMENISLVSWDEVFVLNPELAEGWTWLLDQINVHEMGHAYFGDAVVCRDYAHVWLKESWATYIETCWLEDKRGEDEWKYDFFQNAHAYFAEADGPYSRPIVTRHFDSSWDMFDRHLYPGGACRLHTLRRHLGDDVFWPAVTDYLETFSGQVVETDDFRRILEKHSGRSLAKFFDQWFRTAGYPDLKVDYEFDVDKNEVSFSITQNNAEDDLQAFAFDLDLAWWVDGTRFSKTIHLARKKHTFVTSVSSKPEMVRVDPDCSVLHKLDFDPGTELLKHQLTAGDAIGRILAGRELAKTGKRQYIEAILEAYSAESFWGVRQQWIISIAKANTAAAIQALITILAQEDDAMVLEAFMRNIAGIRDAGLQAAVENKLTDPKLRFPWARSHAWSYLGGQRDAAPIAKLQGAAKMSSVHGIEQAGAINGIGESRASSAVESLITALAYGEPVRSRSAAANALASLGKLSTGLNRERIIERLIDGLRDPSQPVAKACAGALITMHATTAASAVDAFAATLAHQDRVSFQRRLAKIGDPDAKVAELSKALEALKSTHRKLEERLAKLEDKEH